MREKVNCSKYIQIIAIAIDFSIHRFRFEKIVLRHAIILFRYYVLLDIPPTILHINYSELFQPVQYYVVIRSCAQNVVKFVHWILE